MIRNPTIPHINPTSWFAVVILLVLPLVVRGQFGDEPRFAQQLNSRDTSNSQALSDLPDSIFIRAYNPRFPVEQVLVKDSLLDLAYVRFNPLIEHGPDFVYLNSILQPATLNPVLGTPYQQTLPLAQADHPAYEPREAPFYFQNVPFSYVAYNQGGEINDGQAEVALGRSFANGWKLSFNYNRIYNSGQRNFYPQSGGDRIQLGGSVAYMPDSSHTRAYASMALQSAGFFNSGGYTFAFADTLVFPNESFSASSRLTGSRTENKYRKYAYLQRYFLKEQIDSSAFGWAASGEVSYEVVKRRTSVNAQYDTALFSDFAVDDRGLRVEVKSEAVLAKAHLEYFTHPDKAQKLNFNFRAGVYGGWQNLFANYLASSQRLVLFGLSGEMRGSLFKVFDLDAEVDIPFGNRAGEGLLRGTISGTFFRDYQLQGKVLLERSAVPFIAEQVGVNSTLLQRNDFAVNTHSRIGINARHKTLEIEIGGYLDVYSNGLFFTSAGLPTQDNGEVAIGSLEFFAPLTLGPLSVDARGIVRTPQTNSSLSIPAYTGQHSVYTYLNVFKQNMRLMVGLDSWVRSPARPLDFFPLTGTFTVNELNTQTGWQTSVDAFLALKVQSFKAFLRADQVWISPSPTAGEIATVNGYPAIIPEGFLPGGPILRFGVSFFLLN